MNRVLQVPRPGRSVPLALLVILLARQAPAARPVARLLDVQGKVTIERSKDSVRPAQVYGTVYVGEKLIAAGESYAVLGFREDGHLERLKPGVAVTVGTSGCEPRSGVEAVVVPEPRQGTVNGAVRELRPVTQGGVTIVRSGRNPLTGKGSEEALPPQVSPVVGSTVLSRRPTFAWPSVAEATRYEVTVSSGAQRVWYGTTEKPRLEFGAPAALQASFAYHWEVLATLEGQKVHRVCEGEFTVATDQQREKAAELEKLASDGQIPYLALAATWYDENGMVAEALALNERLAKRLPESASIQASLCELYGRSGRGEEAERARRQYRRLQPPPPKPPWLRFPKPK